MAERRVVRILTVHEPQYFGFDGERQLGIVAEAGAALEKFLNERLEKQQLKLNVVILPVSRDLLLPFLEQGRGDIAAAGLTITPERLERVDFTDPSATGVNEIVITGPGVEAPDRLEDLGRIQIHVRRSSSYWESLESLDRRLREEGHAPLRLVPANEVLSDFDLLDMVATGNIQATVVDDYQADFWSQILPDMQRWPQLAVRTDGALAWAVRKDSPVLLEALNDIMRTHRKGTLAGNILIKRYLQDTTRVQSVRRFQEMKPLGGLQALFEKHGKANDLDWMLLAAQAFQESRFDPNARSDRGAVGLMQVTPVAAEEVGISDVSTPERNVEAGAAYLRLVINRYFDDPDLDPRQRQLFAIAGYNAGPVRVRQLRVRAARAGLDPDRWFNNVEIVASREVGSETVRYVSNIFKYYITLSLAIEEQNIKETRTR